MANGGFPGGTSRKESACQCKRCQLDPWVEKKLWNRKMHPASVFLPGKFHGQGNLGGYSPWGHQKPDTTEHPYVSNGYYIEQHIYRSLSSYQKVLLRSTGSEYERFGPILVSIMFPTYLSLEVIKPN